MRLQYDGVRTALTDLGDHVEDALKMAAMGWKRRWIFTGEAAYFGCGVRVTSGNRKFMSSTNFIVFLPRHLR